MVVAMGLLALATPGALYAAVVIGGISYGGLNGIMPPIISELWGLKNFGALYAANALAEGAGSYVMATWLFASVYERQLKVEALDGSASDNGSGGGVGLTADCVGARCFLGTAAVSAVCCGASWLLCEWLGWRSRPRYSALRKQFSHD